MARCAISDLALWREDAHDFESRYTDLLVGPPSRTALARARRPRNVGPGAAPLLLIHGLEDTVVPPEHAELMAAAIGAAGRQCAVELLESRMGCGAETAGASGWRLRWHSSARPPAPLAR